MNIQRERWVLRTRDGKILVGQQKNYNWRSLEDVKDARIASYSSEKKAMRAAESQSLDIEQLGIYAERIVEWYLSYT